MTKMITNPLTKNDIARMSHQELVLELAMRGYIKRGPGRPMGSKNKAKNDRKAMNGKSSCPHCGHEGPIEKDFGTRTMRGEVFSQSWCRDCRAGKTDPKLIAAFQKRQELLQANN